jgi:hypothetical protein
MSVKCNKYWLLLIGLLEMQDIAYIEYFTFSKNLMGFPNLIDINKASAIETSDNSDNMKFVS